MQTDSLVATETTHESEEEKKSSSDVTESENDPQLLESRLDEQSNLIMIIKNRNEETDKKTKGLEEENRYLTQLRDKTEKRLGGQGKILSELTELLKNLQVENDELSVVVSDLSYHKEQLAKEKTRILKENDNLLTLARNEAQKQISSLNQTFIDLDNQCNKVKQNISKETKENERKKKEYRNSIASLKFTHREEVRELMDNLQLKKFAFQETERALKKEEEAYINILTIPEDVIKLEVKHKSLTHEDNAAHREFLIEQLKNNDLRKLVKELGDKVHDKRATFEKKSAEVEAKPAVRELRRKITDAQEQLQQLQNQFKEFKQESQMKLQSEREINLKLRHIH